jgi:hypothetical protein
MTLLASVAVAEDANSLLGKPTEILRRKNASRQMMPGPGGTFRISHDGKYLIYFKPSAPLPEADQADGPQAWMKQMQAAMMQEGILALRDLKSGKEADLLGMPVKRAETMMLSIMDCFGPDSDQALVGLLEFQPGGDSPMNIEPTGTKLYRVKLGGNKPAVTEIKTNKKLAIGMLLPDGKRALIATTDNIKMEPGDLPDLSLMTFGKNNKSKPLGFQAIPMAVHSSGKMAVTVIPRRPRGDRVEWDNDAAWKPAEIKIIDPNSGKVLQQPTIHKNLHMPQQTFFAGGGKVLIYNDVDTVQQGQDEDDGMMGGWEETQPAVRVWDLKSKKIVREFKNHTPIGPGPTDSTIVLARRPENNQQRMGPSSEVMTILLADVKTGKTWKLTESQGLLSARGGKLVYAVEKDGEQIVYVAEIKKPGSEKKEEKQEK